MAEGGKIIGKPGGIVEPGVMYYGRVKGVKGGSDYKPLTKDQTKLLKTRYADEIKKVGSYDKWRADPKNSWKVSGVRKGTITADTFKKNIIDLDALEKIIDRTNLENKIYSQKQISDLYFKEKKIKPKGESRSVIRPSENKEIKNLFDKIIPPEEKVNRVMNQMLISDEPLPKITLGQKDANKFTNWRKYIINEIGQGAGDGLKKLLKNNKFYNQNAEALNYMFNIRNDIEGMNFKDQIEYATKARDGKPRLSGMKGNFSFSPVYRTMDFAFRNWDANKGKGLVKFFDKNGKKITWSPGLKKLDYNTVSFSKGGKQTFSVNGKYNNSISIRANGDQFFPKVFDAVRTRNDLLDSEVDNPFKKGKKILFSELINKIQVEGYGWSPNKKQVLEILHGPDGVAKNPFDNLKVGTSKLNNTLSTLDSIPLKGLKNKIMNQAYGQLKSKKGKKLTEALINQQLEIGKQVAGGKKFPITDRTQIFIDALDPDKQILGPLSTKETEFIKQKLESPSVKSKNIETTKTVNKLLKKLEAHGCKGKAAGGRILFSNGSPDGKITTCATKGITRFIDDLKSGNYSKATKDILKGGGQFIKGALNPMELLKLRNLIGPTAMGFMAAFEGGVITDDVIRQGTPLNESLANNWLTKSFLPYTKQYAQAKNLLESGTVPSNMKKYVQDVVTFNDMLMDMKGIEGRKESRLVDDSFGMIDGTSMYTKEQEQKDNEALMQKGMSLTENVYTPGSAKALEMKSLQDEMEATRMAKKEFSPIFGFDKLKDVRTPGSTSFDYIPDETSKDLRPITYQDAEYTDVRMPVGLEQAYMNKFGLKPRDSLNNYTFKGSDKNVLQELTDEYNMAQRAKQASMYPGYYGANEKFSEGGIASLNVNKK